MSKKAGWLAAVRGCFRRHRARAGRARDARRRGVPVLVRALSRAGAAAPGHAGPRRALQGCEAGGTRGAYRSRARVDANVRSQRRVGHAAVSQDRDQRRRSRGARGLLGAEGAVAAATLTPAPVSSPIGC